MLAAESLADASCPQPRYQQLVEAEVVEAMPGMFMVASRRAVEATFKNSEVFSSEGFLELGNVRPLIPLSVDPPRHLKYRKILDPDLRPEADGRHRGRRHRPGQPLHRPVRSTAASATSPHEFAEQFPSSVFLGPHGPAVGGARHVPPPEGRHPPPGHHRHGSARSACRSSATSARSSTRTSTRILDERLDDTADDILTRFNPAEIDGEKLTREEILDICFLFFIAGLDTVTDSLSCFFAFLGEHPDHRRQIVEQPEIIPSAVEELLRWETPVPNVPRMAKSECPVAGHTMPAGAFVLVNVGAANVDPAEYPDAMEVRFDRDVNRHLAFGGGVHRCLGSHLARRELRVTLREWHRRIPDYGDQARHRAAVRAPACGWSRTWSWSGPRVTLVLLVCCAASPGRSRARGGRW